MSTAYLNLIAASNNPNLLAWLRQARTEISRCREAASTWQTRTEWHGVARGLHIAGKITLDARELLCKAIDEYVDQHGDHLRRHATRIDEE